MVIKVECYSLCNYESHCSSQLFTLPAAENRQKNCVLSPCTRKNIHTEKPVLQIIQGIKFGENSMDVTSICCHV